MLCNLLSRPTALVDLIGVCSEYQKVPDCFVEIAFCSLVERCGAGRTPRANIRTTSDELLKD
jgi:hypothetical protein